MIFSVGQRPNWENLFVQGRVKAIGVPWTGEEKDAIKKLEIPVEYVREGVLTKKDYEDVLKEEARVEKNTGEKPVERLSEDDLHKKAEDLGLHVTPHTPKGVLVDMIKKSDTKNKSKKHD